MPAGRRVQRDVQRLGDLLKGQSLPKFQMHHRALVCRQFRQRFGQRGAEGLFVRIAGRGERRNAFGGELVAGFVTRAAPPDQINRRVVRQPDEKRALVAHTGQQVRVAGEFDENVLEQVAGVGFVAGQVQEKSVKRLGVLVVEPFEVESATCLTV